ncbi:PAS domain S-box-containing protein [Novosphingobium chloroacetimidivorans]|uniref:histidine kinase n=1 Tax=Novosphingobium chloroacetimidivorans TaxID=1428314 RepID=A0A7W7NW37_9SPHN|nr:ATP-binding protein [Novosphingobium chloroacetimidivorans]MBB4857707.1 PAS domain S-box-containing protein [Novosphingobium chloroacetimidivorans]
MSAETPVEGRRVVVCAPFGRDAESVAALLTRAGYEAAVCADLAQVAAHVDDKLGAVLVTEEAMGSGIDLLRDALSRQPPWSDLPFVLLKAQSTGRSAPSSTLDGLAGLVNNTVILERPLGTASLVSAVASALHARRKQFEMRDRIAELAISESRLRLATEAANIGTWDYDPVGNVLRWDTRCKALFGLPPEAAITFEDSFVAGLHPDDRERTNAAVSSALDPEGHADYDIEYRTIGLDDGVERWVAAKGGAVFENGRATRFVGTIMDVSERKRAEAALAASEAALREESHALEILNRTGSQVAAELDLDTLVQAVVDAGRELTGAEAGAFFYNKVDESGEGYLLFSLSGPPASAFENYPMPRNTALFGPTFTGQGVVRSDDIRQDPRYGRNDTYHGMPAGHIPVVSYLAVPVASRSGEVIGGLFFGHHLPAQFGDRAERLAMGLASQAAISIENARLIQAAQRLNQTLEQKVAERTRDLEEEMASRARAEAALRQSQKMEAVGQLTGGIAHDFNNMLTGVIGGLDIVKRRIASGRTQDLDRFMDAAAASAHRAASLTARLLAFSRRQSLDARPLDVNALTASLDDLLRRTINENIALKIVPGPHAPHAIADANQLENAILNLAINARDAMPDGGQLTVEVQTVELDQAYAATEPDVAPGRYVVVAVSDTGVGMPADVIEKVFEPFFTTKPIGQGTGLGLSMVYGFARQSGGQVRIHSRPGEGTSVKIYLPACEGDVAGQSDGPRAVQEGHGQTVLVVEDDPSVRLLVREVLEELGYAPIEASDAVEAIPILRSAQAIDLLVSDVGLPGMNGRQLAEVAREHRPDLPILFVTGYAENAAIRAGFLGTNMAMITKPFAIEALAAKIGEMVN